MGNTIEEAKQKNPTYDSLYRDVVRSRWL